MNRYLFPHIAFGVVAFLLCSCIGRNAQTEQIPKPEYIQKMEVAIQKAISEGKTPGAVLEVVRKGKVVQKATYGNRSLDPLTAPMTIDTLFDLASLSKVMGTATATMLLMEDGTLSLNTPVCQIIPEFAEQDKQEVTILDLLTHRSGLPPYVFWQKVEKNRGNVSQDQALIQYICSLPKQYSTGEKYGYSCLNYLILGRVNEKIAGESQEELLKKRIWNPLGMKDTTYFPTKEQQKRLAPEFPPSFLHKQVDPDHVLSHYYTEHQPGDINDSLAFYYSVSKEHCAGNAGLFSTVDDISRYAQMILNEGKGNGVRVLNKNSVRQMTSLHSDLPHYSSGEVWNRGLGWVVYSQFPYTHPVIPQGSTIGHTGYTGTYLWIDQHSRSYLILLTNAVHADPNPNVNPLRGAVTRALVEELYGARTDKPIMQYPKPR